MTLINSWMRNYAEKQTFQSPSVTALKSVNLIMAIMAATVGVLMLGPNDLFLQPTTPPDDWWLSPTIGMFDLWEILFVLGAILLMISTTLLKRIIVAHTLLGLTWFSLGLLWTIGGILNSPSYLFGVGILGIFMALQHVGLIGLWRAEGA